MSLTNSAAWISGPGEQIEVGPADVGKPGTGEVLIQNHAVAINPVDWKVQTTGLFVQSWPTVLGADIAGEVVEVGEGVTHITKGQRVLAHALRLLTGKVENAGFQNYTVALAAVTSPIPDQMSFVEAAVLPLSVSTAASGLFRDDFLGLPLPSTSPVKSGKTLLLWGGSSSVGSQVIQLATASGVDVITTASKKNFDYCKKLGAKGVFDYSSSSVVGDLTAALQGTQVLGAFDAAGFRESTLQVAQVLAQIGGGTIATVSSPPSDLPATVNAKPILATRIVHGQPGVAKGIYEDFLPAALQSGQIIPAPQPKVIGHGLQQLQAGCDELKKGVSAVKLVLIL